MHARCGVVTVVAEARSPVSFVAFQLRMGSKHPRLLSWIAVVSLILLNSLTGPWGRAQSVDAGKDVANASLLSVPPRSWAADAAANELIALHHKGSYLRYRMETVNEKGDQVRDVIESKD